MTTSKLQKMLHQHHYHPWLWRWPELIAVLNRLEYAFFPRNATVWRFLKHEMSRLEPADHGPVWLDAGFGYGQFLYRAARQLPGVRFLVLENAQTHLQFAARYAERTGLNNIQPIYQDLSAAPQYAGPLQTIVCVSVMQYVDDPLALLRYWRSQASPDGRLFLYMPLQHETVVVPYDQNQKRHWLTEEQVVALLQEAGWQVIQKTAAVGRWGYAAHLLHHHLARTFLATPFVLRLPLGLFYVAPLLVLFAILLLLNGVWKIPPFRGMLFVGRPSMSGLD